MMHGAHSNKPPSRRLSRRSGIALLLSLVFIVLLTSLVVDFMYSAQVDASLAMSKDSRFQAFVAAKSAVAEGMALLESDLIQSVSGGDTGTGMTSNTQNRANTNQSDRSSPSNTGSSTNTNDATSAFPPGEYDSYYDSVPWAGGAPIKPMNDAVMRTSISDEYGKINLNALLVMGDSGQLEENEYLISALRTFFQLRDPQLETDPVDAILDWLDYGDMDETRQEGAENDYYTSLEIPYPCKNGPMDSIEELLLIKGITPELYYGDPSMAQSGDRPESKKPDDSSVKDTDRMMSGRDQERLGLDGRTSGRSDDRMNERADQRTTRSDMEDEEEILPLSEYLTVHGDWQGKINANTAEYDVLLAVLTGYSESDSGDGFSPDLVTDQIFEYQYNEQPITSVSELERMFPRQRNRRNRLQQNPAVPSPHSTGLGLEKQGLGTGMGIGRGGSGADSGFGTGTGLGTGTGTGAGTGTGTGTGTGSSSSISDGPDSASDVLRVDSYVFRIQGDGMKDNTLVRIEAYVWRTPFDQNSLEGGGTTDPFRILSWRVIQ